MSPCGPHSKRRWKSGWLYIMRSGYGEIEHGCAGIGVVSRFVSWDHREYMSEYSVDGLPGMTEQFGSWPEPAGLPFA